MHNVLYVLAQYYYVSLHPTAHKQVVNITHSHTLSHTHTHTHTLTHTHLLTHTHTHLLTHSHTHTHKLTSVHSILHTNAHIHIRTYYLWYTYVHNMFNNTRIHALTNSRQYTFTMSTQAHQWTNNITWVVGVSCLPQHNQPQDCLKYVDTYVRVHAHRGGYRGHPTLPFLTAIVNR